MSGPDDGVSSSQEYFQSVVEFLQGEEAAGLEHGGLEARLEEHSRELFRRLTQDHLDMRAQREKPLDEVRDAPGVDRPSTEAGHTRTLATVFGEVTVTRLAYRRRGQANLHP